MNKNIYNDIGIGLIMSRACNLNCAYCMQNKLGISHMPEEERTKRVDDIINFVQEISANRDNSIPLFISFYGGEPLLSMKDVEHIINDIQDESKFHFEMTTNGKLLSPGIVRFMNEHKVHVQISWDGEASKKKRGYDAVEEKWDLIKALDYVCFSSVVTKEARISDRIQMVSELEDEYFSERGRHMERHAIYTVKGESKENSYPVESYKKDLHTLFEKAKNYELSYTEELYVFNLTNRLRAYLNKEYYVPGETTCLRGTMIPVSMDGSVRSCINTDDKVATIDMPVCDIISSIKAANTTEQAEKCKQCRYAALSSVTPACKLEEQLCRGNRCESCKTFGNAILKEAASVFGEKVS